VRCDYSRDSANSRAIRWIVVTGRYCAFTRRSDVMTVVTHHSTKYCIVLYNRSVVMTVVTHHSTKYCNVLYNRSDVMTAVTHHSTKYCNVLYNRSRTVQARPFKFVTRRHGRHRCMKPRVVNCVKMGPNSSLRTNSVSETPDFYFARL
jgi:hypothetical protein